MAISFLIPLAIAAITIYARYQIQEEIMVVLFNLTAAIGILLGFIMAPWIVQISLLAVGLWGMRYI
jgi:hypothetical protein